MQEALRRDLYQATNYALTDIRSKEVQYYSSVYLNFGTQASIMAGFAYASLNQVPNFRINVDYHRYDIVQGLFWCSSALCMGFSVHCILITSFIQIFGSGMALHGPSGSVIIAAERMRSEMDNVFNSYILTEQQLREEITHQQKSDKLHSSGHETNTACNPIHEGLGFSNNSPSLANGHSKTSRGITEDSEDKIVIMSGYLTFQEVTKITNTWHRRFVIFTKSKHLFYYTSKYDYDANADSSINNRPIEVGDYNVSVKTPQESLQLSNHAKLLVWEITLDHKDKGSQNFRSWRFRCDNYDEVKQWSDVLNVQI